MLFVGSFPCSSRRSQLANALDAGADRCTSPSAAAAALALRRPCFLALVVGPSSLDPQEVGKRRSSQQQTPCYARVMAPLLQPVNRARRRRWSRGSGEGAETASLRLEASASRDFFLFLFYQKKSCWVANFFWMVWGPPGAPIRSAVGWARVRGRRSAALAG